MGQKLWERSRGELVTIDAPVGGLTTGKLLNDYLLRRQRLSPGTLNTYRYRIELLIKPFFGLLLPAKITTDMISDFRSTQKVVHHNGGPGGTRTTLDRNEGDTSINGELGLLGSGLRDLSKRRPTPLPSVPYFPMEKEDNARQRLLYYRTWTSATISTRSCLGICAPLQLARIFAGGRKGEWLHLDWEEVDFDALVIRFVKTKNKHPREVPSVPGLMLDSLREAFRLRNAAWPDESAAFRTTAIQ